MRVRVSAPNRFFSNRNRASLSPDAINFRKHRNKQAELKAPAHGNLLTPGTRPDEPIIEGRYFPRSGIDPARRIVPRRKKMMKSLVNVSLLARWRAIRTGGFNDDGDQRGRISLVDRTRT